METKYNKEILIKSHVLHGQEPHCFGHGHLFSITFIKIKYHVPVKGVSSPGKKKVKLIYQNNHMDW